MQLKAASLLLAGCVLIGNAAAVNSVPGHPIAAPPKIDGVIEEGEWQGVPSFEGLLDAQTGQAAAEGGRFWLAYDSKFIYFAARLEDSQPGSIRANEYRTNVSLSGDDFVQLRLDLSGSLADFNSFGINPKGATDIQLAGGRAAKREWSGEFFAQSRITDNGWEVEARIPWQVMRLPSSGKRNIRFNVVRQHLRTQRIYNWAYVLSAPENYGFWSEVNVPRQAVDHTIKLLPYSYIGYSDKEGLIFNSGLDLKTNLTEEIPLIGSINPDFRNIENQLLSIDFSRFERLAGETRPFFQEGRQYFNSALFASQRIANFDAGLNIHGKLSDKVSFGVLDTVDVGEQNNFAGNLTYDPTPFDSFRFTGTSLRREGLNNEASLIRYQKTLGSNAIFLRNMATKDTVRGEGVWNTGSFFSNGPVWGTYFSYDTVSPAFFPRLGFAPEVDYKGVNTQITNFQALKHGPLSQVGLVLSGLYYDHYHGGFYRKNVNPTIDLTWRNGLRVTTFAFLENFQGVHDKLYGINFAYPQNNPYNRMVLDLQTGELAEQPYKSVTVGAAYKPIRQLQLTSTLQFVDHFERNDQFIVGMNYDLGNDMSLSGRTVKRDQDWNAYIALRRSGNRGMEYFLILGDPNSRTFRSSLILKMVVPFDIG